MKKKRSIGVTLFAVLALLFSFSYLSELAALSQVLNQVLILIIGFSFLVSGVFLLLLKNWARTLFLLATAAQSIIYIKWYLGNHSLSIFNKISGLAVVVLPFLIILFFFTRPKVKEQFK